MLSSRGLLALGAVFVAAFAGAADLSLQVESVFEGIPSWQGNCPLLITVENKGANASGVVTVDCQGSGMTMRYPIDIPTGSKKQLISYLDSRVSFGGAQVVLSTNRGSAQMRFEFNQTIQGGVAAIGDSIGSLQSVGRKNPRITNLYVKPERAPDRSVGYLDMRGVFLTEGAERLHDDQVRALHEYVLRGGRLFFLGAPASPILKDVRWSKLLPIQGFQQKTIVARPGEAMGELLPVGEFTLVSAQPAPGAYVRMSYRGEPLVVRRSFGSGFAEFLAIDPSERPAQRWEGIGAFLSARIESTDAFNSGAVVMPLVRSYGGPPPAVYSSTPGRTPVPVYGSSGYPYTSSENSPFDVQLPDAGLVFFILVAYIVLVAPVNILVLRKLKRQELAWITSPLISLGFAAIFFSFAAALYKAGFSRTVEGVVWCDRNYPDALYQGRNEFYSAKGGVYDLKAENVQQAFSKEQEDYYQAGQVESYDLADTGSVRLNAVQLGNLSFRKVALIQRLPNFGKVDLTLRKTGPKTIAIRLANNSPFALNGCQVRSGWGRFSLPVVAPSQTINVNVSVQQNIPSQGTRPTLVAQITNDALVGIRLGTVAGQTLNLTATGDYIGETP